MHPAALEFAGIVMSQSQRRSSLFGDIGQDGRFGHYLKTVADSQDQPAVGYETGDVFSHSGFQFIGQDLARSNIVSVGESAGNDYHLVVREASLVAYQLI